MIGSWCTAYLKSKAVDCAKLNFLIEWSPDTPQSLHCSQRVAYVDTLRWFASIVNEHVYISVAYSTGLTQLTPHPPKYNVTGLKYQQSWWNSTFVKFT